MSFTFNDLNGSSKSNATAACSTNSPSKSNLNTDDFVKKTGDKSNLNFDSAAGGSKSDSNSSLFVFGTHSQKKNSDLKAPEGFNFVFNSNSFDQSSSKSNTEAVKSTGIDLGLNLFDNKDRMEPKVEDKTAAVFDSDNNNGNSSENSTENSVKDEELTGREHKQDERAPNEEMMVVKTLVKEFKDVINSFVKERVEGERKIAALEGRIRTLEEEVQNLKSEDSKKSSTVSVTNDNDTAKPIVNSIAQQSLEQPPVLVSRQTPSPLTPSPLAEPSTLKKSAFGSTSSIFGASSAPLFNGHSTNSFGAAASSLLGNDTITSSNFTLGTSMFNPSPPTQVQGASTLFGASVQTSNQNGNNLAPEPKKGNPPKKLFTQEAVTTFLNAQKDAGMNNNSTKVNTGNPLKKTTTGQDSLEQNQTPKDAFQANLQRTIEMSVKKFMEEYWK